MNPIILAVLAVTVIGIICALMLAFAAKVMHVKVNERFNALRDCLPGANCGACGFAGCDGYAQALLDDSSTKTNLCPPGGNSAAKALAKVLGVEAEHVIEQVAVIACMGDCSVTEDKMDYRGIQSCEAAKLLFGGRGKCTWGCMGLGDCAAICPNDAICVENGLAHINTRKCIGCGMCANICPQKIITIMADVERVLVTCSNTEKGAVTKSKCSHGCIGCGRCVKACPNKAISVKNNLAHIEYAYCHTCENCASVCPTGCIMIADFSGIHRSILAEKQTADG